MYQEDLMLTSPGGPPAADRFLVEFAPSTGSAKPEGTLDGTTAASKHDVITILYFGRILRCFRPLSGASNFSPSSLGPRFAPLCKAQTIRASPRKPAPPPWRSLSGWVKRPRVARAPTIVPPADLTLPHPGSSTVRSLYSATLSVAMTATLAILSRSEAAAIVQVLRSEPGLLARSLRAPSRLVLVRCLMFLTDAAAERERWACELAAQMCLDVAEAGRLPAVVSIDLANDPLSGQPRPLFSLDLGVAHDLSGAARLRFVPALSTSPARLDIVSTAANSGANDVRSIPLGGAAKPLGSHPLFASIAGGWCLGLEDNNPLASLEAHPDKSGSLIDLGGKSVEAWTTAMGAAFSTLERYLPEIVDEMRLLLGAVVPVGFDDQKHLSASYLEAIGLVYLTLHPNVMTLAEALVHEFQHNKLNLLLGLDPVLENGEHPLFSSPVRPDRAADKRRHAERNQTPREQSRGG